MMLVVPLTCLLSRLGADDAATRAAVTFLAAELTLASLVPGVSKGASKYWQSGEAFAMIVRARMRSPSGRALVRADGAPLRSPAYQPQSRTGS
jgi:hypothetical protein